MFLTPYSSECSVVYYSFLGEFGSVDEWVHWCYPSQDPSETTQSSPFPMEAFREKYLCLRTLWIDHTLTFRHFTDNQKSWTPCLPQGASLSISYRSCLSQLPAWIRWQQGKPTCMHCNVWATAAIRNCSKVLSQPASFHSI